jgi:uncharacterized C2H2 Zn-finger protein
MPWQGKACSAAMSIPYLTKTQDDTSSHSLYFKFTQAVSKHCDEVAHKLQYKLPSRNEHLLKNLEQLLDFHHRLNRQAPTNSPMNNTQAGFSMSSNIQELPGSPVNAITWAKPGNISPENRQQLQWPQLSTPTSTSSASPSTNISSATASTSETPISIHSISPATEELPTAFNISWSDWALDLPFEENEYNAISLQNTPFDTIISSEQPKQPKQQQYIPLGGESPAPVPANPIVAKESGSIEGSAQCPLCGKILRGKTQYISSNLKRHMREQHNDAAKHLMCETCGRSFTRNHNLTHHQKTVHNPNRT